MSIAANLGRLAACNQFFVYRLSQRDPVTGKWVKKQPWSLKYDRVIGPDKHYNWMSYDAALAAVLRQPETPGVAWCVGLWITESLGVFFLDIDRLPADYTTTSEADALIARFPGCMIEWSSSRRGVHVVGSRTADIDHATDAEGGLELYSHSRGIALATSAQGSADTDATEAFVALATSTFPARARAPVGLVMPPIPGAPADLSALSLVLRQADRITRAPQGERNAALNGAAFVVGGMVGAGRISRDEARAALVSAVERAGWGDMDVQCGKIDQALDAGAQEPIARAVPGVPVVATPGVPDVPTVDTAAPGVNWTAIVDQAIERIRHAMTYDELMDTVVPEIAALCIPVVRSPRVVTALSKRLDLFDNALPIGTVRQMVCSPQAARATTTTRPDWIGVFCYIKRTDNFYNTLTGTEYSHESFRTDYARFMPQKQSGDREDPVKWARERWDITSVDDSQYRPDMPTFFEYAGQQYVNRFIAATMPAICAPTPGCHIAIQAFQDHLRLLCGGREWLYTKLLQWLAFNVQQPGHKIRWSPLIKGVGGDGKSIVGDLIFAAMGDANVKITSVSNISNSGGFTDWATGKAVNFIEEIRLEGKEKRKLYNAMKIFVGDRRIDLNRKGKASADTMVNITNHWANSNYGDAMPLDDDDRRWCIVFTPYTTIDEAVAAKGLPSVDSLVAHFKMLGASMRSEPGAWRGWLMSIDTSSFDPDGRAPDTDERKSMMLMASDSADQVIVDILDQGAPGITKFVFSSSRLMGQVQIRGGERPHDRGWNSTLTRLGYRQMSKTIWWQGSSHRIWAKKDMTADEIREILDKT